MGLVTVGQLIKVLQEFDPREYVSVWDMSSEQEVLHIERVKRVDEINKVVIMVREPE